METFSALLAICAGNSPVTGEFPSQRPVTRSCGVFFDLRLNKRLCKQLLGWWFEVPLGSLLHHCNNEWLDTSQICLSHESENHDRFRPSYSRILSFLVTDSELRTLPSMLGTKIMAIVTNNAHKPAARAILDSFCPSNCITKRWRQKSLPLRWRHNGHYSVSNHQPHHCLLNRLIGCRSKKTSKLRVTGLCAGNWPGTGEFPAQMASNAENVSIWWRHHDMCRLYNPNITNLRRYHFGNIGYIWVWNWTVSLI